ncbi:casein kinase II subunit beta family protein [Dyella lipolytica]|uniref:Uncharacterized protein n=1 Tax=Dyella lipolytica TaxID=1867835 RepID=A0ABW8IU79_9GAMM|nr:hypothetical protein [Dyella lipolytica]
MTARHLTIVHYPPQEPYRCVEIRSPGWEDVSAAIQRMDDNEYPVVQLSWEDVDTCFEDEASFNIVGGTASGFALSEMNGWRLDDPNGSDEGVRLWQSDQGYFCKRRNIIAEIDVVLKLTKIYFETGSYDEVRRAWSEERGPVHLSDNQT